MADSSVDTFLETEEQAHRLVEELTRLKSEADSFNLARKTIDQVADGVTTLVGSLSEISGRLAVVVETLRVIGTPELLRGQEAVAGELASLRQDLSATERSVADAVAQPAGQLRALHDALAGMEQTRQEQLHRMEEKISALATADSVSALQQELEQRHLAHRNEVLAVKEALKQEINALATAESVSALRQDLEQRHLAQRKEVLDVKEDLGGRVAVGVAAVKKLAVAGIGLSLVTLALVGWLVLTLAGG